MSPEGVLGSVALITLVFLVLVWRILAQIRVLGPGHFDEDRRHSCAGRGRGLLHGRWVTPLPQPAPGEDRSCRTNLEVGRCGW
jgi:hypothetical protein